MMSLEKHKKQKKGEKEAERKRSLEEFLEAVGKLDLLDIFMDKNIQLNEALNITNSDLSKMGVSFLKRKGWKDGTKLRRGTYFVNMTLKKSRARKRTINKCPLLKHIFRS